jgi:uncharacterized protein
MTPPNDRSKHDWKPILYIIGFFVVWTAYIAFFYPQVERLGVDTLPFALVHIALKILIWIVPVFVYLHFIDKVNPFDYLKLRQKWKTGLIVGLALSLINFGIFFVQFGVPRLDSSHVTWNSILSTSIAIGFIEEIPFRGFMLQKLNTMFSNFWIANLITSLLFLLVHIIGWILLSSEQTLYLYVSIFAFGFVMGIIFRCSDSLWSVIIVHSLNDFFSAVLFAR